MKKYIIIILFLFSNSMIHAQSTPLYPCDTLQPNVGAPVATSNIPLDGVTNLMQCIYYQTDFPGMSPQGQITDFYISIASITPKGAVLRGLTVKMKPTGKMGFPTSMGAGFNNQIETGLTTVYYDSLFVLPDSLQQGDWLHLTLPIPYSYSFISGGDSNRNLMVEVSQDSTFWANSKFDAYVYQYSGSENRCITYGIQAPYNDVGFPRAVLVIGFNPKPDPPPLGIQEQSNLKELMIYPNPAKDKVYLPQKGIYKLYNIKGGFVLQTNTANDNTIDVSRLPAGVYIIRGMEDNSIYRFTKQ